MMSPKGKLLIIGGHEDRSDTDVEMKEINRNFSPNQILKHLVHSKNDRIEVITTASSEPESMRDTYKKTFKEIGYTNFDFMHIDKNENPDLYLQRISDAKAVFFTGGDQNRICTHLDKSVRDLLKEKYLNEENFTIAGTSAGAMCMSEVIICDAVNGEAIIENDITLDSGLGLITNCIVDTHFVHRGRFGRLAHAVLLEQKLYGVGLGEDTALLIENGSQAVCKGSGMVIMISAKDIDQSNVDTVDKGYPIYAENLRVDLLTENCKIDLDSGRMIGSDVSSC